jgi:lipopolysaccharide biosynthesis regulator YciM
MFIFLLSLIVIAIAFVGGFYAGIKNAKSSKVEKANEVFKALKD